MSLITHHQEFVLHGSRSRVLQGNWRTYSVLGRVGRGEVELGVVCNRPTTNWARGWQCAAAPSAHVAAPTIMPPKGSIAARQSASKNNYELKKVLEVSEQSACVTGCARTWACVRVRAECVHPPQTLSPVMWLAAGLVPPDSVSGCGRDDSDEPRPPCRCQRTVHLAGDGPRRMGLPIRRIWALSGCRATPCGRGPAPRR